jgi:hypothetical protein
MIGTLGVVFQKKGDLRAAEEAFSRARGLAGGRAHTP